MAWQHTRLSVAAANGGYGTTVIRECLSDQKIGFRGRVPAASLAMKQHEIQISVPGSETATGAANAR